VLLLAAIGMVSSFVARRTPHGTPHAAPSTPHLFWPLYLALYSVLTCIALSAIPYKTPWNLLPFYIGLVLMAGCGVSALLRWKPRSTSRNVGLGVGVARATVLLGLVIAAIQLASQARRACFRYAADPRNPYAFVQTSPDFLRLVKRVQDISKIDRAGSNMLVKVVAGPYEQWPLPWYLRGMSRVGYWTTPSGAAPFEGVPIVIASAENAAALDAALGDRYQAEFYGLRPNVLLTLFIERGRWERFLENSNSAFRIHN
jgi:predicted membrane-bound mannosyltransferase